MYIEEILHFATRKDLHTFTTNDEFMAYSVDLYKEFFTLFSAAISLKEMCDKCLDRKKSILFGLLRKLEDLSLNCLNLLCNGSVDSCQVLMRTSKEVAVTVLLMMDKYEDDMLFDDYIKYSLITEKNYYGFLEKDDDDPDKQGILIGMRKRMKKSIISSFQDAGVDINQLDIAYEKKNNFWSKTKIHDRFKIVGIENLYESYRLDCHSTHGNWQNLKHNFLNHEPQGIKVDYQKHRARPQLVLSFIVIHELVLSKALDIFVHDSDVKGYINSHLEACIHEVIKVDTAHEVLLQSSNHN
jgi:hypothetical protein